MGNNEKVVEILLQIIDLSKSNEKTLSVARKKLINYLVFFFNFYYSSHIFLMSLFQIFFYIMIFSLKWKNDNLLLILLISHNVLILQSLTVFTLSIKKQKILNINNLFINSQIFVLMVIILLSLWKLVSLILS